MEITDQDPYREIVRFLSTQHGAAEQVFRTLSYFAGMNFAARAHTRALYSVALMDAVCPPSTVFAAYDHWARPKEIQVNPWNNHEGGSATQVGVQLRALRELS
ncbi:acetylxylan esterase [Streptomyces finlayi]|uniref:acetylxylan esterase n=1 Tax=Streptomyces finlayi TaxID=67296 RepID=UPI0027E4D209|nr:acetylxylan esterase [Streptomyces finlayi]